MYGLTCRRNEKTGTFNLISREECACNYYHENVRFQEILRENKRKTRVRYEPSFCLLTSILIQSKSGAFSIKNRYIIKLRNIVKKQIVYEGV